MMPVDRGAEGVELHLGDLVEVLWDDAACWYAESEEEDWRDEQEIITYGVVVKLTEKSVFLAGELQVDNGTYRGVTRLPWPYIIACNVLRCLDAS